MGNPGMAEGGVLIRNANGEWVKGYARAIGCATSVAMELWALRDGIQLCISLKVPAKDMDNKNGVGILVVDYKEGMKKIPLVHIQPCYKEANKCADALARRGASLAQDFTIFMDPPADVAFLLNLDSAGTIYFRDVAFVVEGS
ncbi:uncharacterized protein LOC126689825 [Quercus robur]|uniref:uncharacterized protein LOC126689825 n=1 Tax=Quercus robur TaxID=38942 RepID=UPI002161C88D|nr:uncharacterized protein LOC126689825 [Quercus robur]